ncbi:MAG TPA: COX15/CtaA family protein [Candidatus Methylomirabilis sp.]|nr:COX15/CtaA family protein [Candidatus Methylomirabilis sp.]
MKATYHPVVNRFAVFTVCWTVLLFVAGALVTSNDAALSVTDWPKSHGAWIPRTLAGGDVYEFSHRVVAGVLGVLTLLLAIGLWVKEERRWLRWFAVIAVGGIVAQAILGGQVVIQLLHYWLPVMHACFAQIMFAALLSIAVFTSKWWVAEHPQLEDRGSLSIHSLALLNAIVIFFQVFLGAGFRHKDIPIWPHAAGSLVVLATLVWTAAVLRKRFENSRELTRMRILLHSFFGVQFLLGIGALWSRIATADAPQPMPVMVWTTVIHTVVGALLFGVSILTILVCYRLVPRIKAVEVTSHRQVEI